MDYQHWIFQQLIHFPVLLYFIYWSLWSWTPTHTFSITALHKQFTPSSRASIRMMSHSPWNISCLQQAMGVATLALNEDYLPLAKKLLITVSIRNRRPNYPQYFVFSSFGGVHFKKNRIRLAQQQFEILSSNFFSFSPNWTVITTFNTL